MLGLFGALADKRTAEAPAPPAAEPVPEPEEAPGQAEPEPEGGEASQTEEAAPGDAPTEA
jgi:hypothetical protein